MINGKILFFIYFAFLVLISCKQQNKIDESTPLFPVFRDGKYGYINKTGKIVIKPQFDDARPFFEGVAEAWIDDNCCYINRTGKYIWESAQ